MIIARCLGFVGRYIVEPIAEAYGFIFMLCAYAYCLWGK